MIIFVVSFLISSLLLWIIFQVKTRMHQLKHQRNREELKNLTLFLWEIVPILLLSFILIYGMKSSQKLLMAKRGSAKEKISTLAFTRD